MICVSSFVSWFFAFFLLLHSFQVLESKFIQTHHHYPKIALTRDEEGNQRLQKLLAQRGIPSVPLPCIQFKQGKDKILNQNCDIFVVTSLQGATRLGDEWLKNKTPIKVASIGTSTSNRLKQYGIVPVFQPSQATAECLGKELPKDYGTRVIYPTSNLADSTLFNTLTSRGFRVTQLEAYQTIAPVWNKDTIKKAKEIDIVTFLSPSAAIFWANNVGNDFNAVALGPTTSKAARELNFREVRSSKTVKIESLVDTLEKYYHECKGDSPTSE